MSKSHGGKKGKSFKKNVGKTAVLSDVTPDNETTFAGCITKALGCCRFIVQIPIVGEISTSLPGSLKRGNRVNIGDMVFVQLTTELSGAGSYILYVYNDAELSVLKIKRPVATTSATSVDDFDFETGIEEIVDTNFDNI